MSTESWYTTRNTSTWFEVSDAQAWIPAQQNVPESNIKTLPNASMNIKNLKTGKSDSSDRGLKEQKLEQHRAVAPPQSDLSSKFFELSSNTISDQNAWNAYVMNASPDGWDNPNDTKTPVPDKVLFSKLRRNVDIEAELTKQNLYKTEQCQSWIETGSCRYGTKCQYAHGKEELRPVIRHPKYKTEVCKTFSTTGQCPYGKRCRFVHQLFELRSDDEDNLEEEEMLQRKLQEISLSLAPDPVFSEENSDPVISPNHVKKGSRLPFLQKLRKQL